LPLVIGFLLTTVLGGLLGTFLQQRSWKHQYEAQLRDQEFRRADGVSEAISQLLDKRLYRMLRLFYALRRVARGSSSMKEVEQPLADYNLVLYEWNDRLNLNLALIGVYFGESARDWLANRIYKTYQQIGAELEELRRELSEGGRGTELTERLEDDLLALNDQVYRLGLFMMTQLRSGRIGRGAPQMLPRSDSPASIAGRAVPLVGIREEEPPARS
jgi:hypothetical protein